MSASKETSPAEELKRMRKAAGYTQESLGTAICMTKQAVNHWETGVATPGRNAFQKMQVILGKLPEFKSRDIKLAPWFVYFASQPTGLIKIGISSAIEKRIRSIEIHSGFPTTLIETWQYSTRKEAAAVEAYLKNHFADKNTLGEWFEGIEVPAARINLISCEQAA